MSYTSVLTNIATLVRDLTNTILFEFTKYNHDNGENTFLYAMVMYTLPTDINYTYPSRNKFTQTLNSGFLDKFPMGYPKIKISGTFGKNRRGLLYLDGLTRLSLFKGLLKQYHSTESDESKISDFVSELGAIAAGVNKNLIKEIYELKDYEVYVMTLYDFINSEIWAVDPSTFDISESATTKANLPRYTLQMQAIGKPPGGKIDDILKKTMNVRDNFLLADALLGNLALSERWRNQVSPLWSKLKNGFSG